MMYYGPYSDNLSIFTILKQIAQIPQNLLLARVKGPLYGSRDSPKLWNESFNRFMKVIGSLADQGYELDTGVHGSSANLQSEAQRVVSSYMQGEDDPCCFKHPVTGMRVVEWID